MTFLDPYFLLPHYETEDKGQLRACWPGLVAVARTEETTKDAVFHELSPLPGGFFMGGVGYVSHGPQFREEVQGLVCAGADLQEALRLALSTVPDPDGRASACYVHFDPVEATLRVESEGAHVSAVRLPAGSGQLLGSSATPTAPTVLALRPGEALVLIAHPRAWDKHVLSAIHRALPEDVGSLDEEDVQALCGVVDALPGPTARLLLYRSDGAGTPNAGGREDQLLPAGELDPHWTVEDLEFLDGLRVESLVSTGFRREP
jgi:hypothetical protein